MSNLQAAKSAFGVLWQTLLIGSLAGWVLVATVPPLYDVARLKFGPPVLVVTDFYYEAGYFYQQVEPSKGETLRGDWAAQIWDDEGNLMCSGSGDAPYQPKLKPVRFTPDDWTGNTCNLVAGVEYRAVASWKTVDPDGRPHSVPIDITFIHEDAD